MAKLKIPVGPADHAQGPANAPVTLVEYGDYECPHCGRAHPIVKALQKRFGRQLRFVFRNFPLREIHPTPKLPPKLLSLPPRRISSGRCTTSFSRTNRISARNSYRIWRNGLSSMRGNWQERLRLANSPSA